MGFEMGVPGSTVAAALGPAALIGGVAAFFGAALALADAKRASTFARVVSMGLPFFAVVCVVGDIAQLQSPTMPTRAEPTLQYTGTEVLVLRCNDCNMIDNALICNHKVSIH